jgi:hypothetical protein
MRRWSRKTVPFCGVTGVSSVLACVGMLGLEGVRREWPETLPVAKGKREKGSAVRGSGA